jgi:hypothetical protein
LFLFRYGAFNLAHGFDPQPARSCGERLRESIGPFDNHHAALVKIFVEPISSISACRLSRKKSK